MKTPLIHDLTRVLSTFARIVDKPIPPVEAYVAALQRFDLTGDELAEIATRMYSEYSSGYGRLPLPSEFVKIAEQVIEETRAPRIVHTTLLSDDEITQCRVNSGLMSKSLRMTLALPREEWKSKLEAALERVYGQDVVRKYECERCHDSGLLQVYGFLGKPREKHRVREKATITYIESQIVPNSPFWEFPYPDLVEAPEGTSRMVARCSCRHADKYSGVRPSPSPQ